MCIKDLGLIKMSANCVLRISIFVAYVKGRYQCIMFLTPSIRLYPEPVGTWETDRKGINKIEQIVAALDGKNTAVLSLPIHRSFSFTSVDSWIVIKYLPCPKVIVFLASFPRVERKNWGNPTQLAAPHDFKIRSNIPQGGTVTRFVGQAH